MRGGFRLGMKEHVHVVERAGLVTTEKVGRVRTRIKVPVDRRRRSAAGEPVRYQRRAGSGRGGVLPGAVEGVPARAAPGLKLPATHFPAENKKGNAGFRRTKPPSGIMPRLQGKENGSLGR